MSYIFKRYTEIEKGLKERKTQNKFREEIEKILEEIKSDFPTLSQTLDLQDEEIYQKIIQSIQFSKESQQREQFVNAIRKDVIVNPEDVKRRMAQQYDEGKENHDSEPSL